MEFIDARRLTGPSLLFDKPGAILDVGCSAGDADRLIPVWEQHIQHMLAELGWVDCELRALKLLGGVSLAFTSPIDTLYAASEVNEWAWAACDNELNGADAPDFAKALADIRSSVEEESNAELLQLMHAAEVRDQTFLCTHWNESV